MLGPPPVSDFHNPLIPPLRLPANFTEASARRDPVAPGAVGTSRELERIEERIRGFNWKRSWVWIHLTSVYGPKLTQEELVSLADLIASALHIKLDRDARRRKTVMIKWFEENWLRIRPILPYMVLGH
jgi:hypothetical protein